MPNIDSFYLLKIMINIPAYIDVQEFPARQISHFVSQKSCLEEFKLIIRYKNRRVKQE